MTENENKIRNILDNILHMHKPSRQESEKVVRTVNEFISKLDKRRDELGIKAEIMLGGSVAKGTFIKDKFDSDVFIRFNRSYSDEELSELLEKMLKPWRNTVRIHGSRDYFQLKYRGVDFELVPVFKITDPKQAINVTDTSPLHVNWIKSQLKNKSHLRDDIILTKMFCKAQRVYGAESYIMGFSGHVTDILIIHYDGFINLLKNASKWEEKITIDFMKHGDNLNKSKIYSPLILIDPVQPERNAAAALSKEKFDKFKDAAREFLKTPSKESFKVKKIKKRELKDMAGENKLIIIDILPKDGKKDVIGCKLLKSFEYIKKRLSLNDFEVIHAGWEWNKRAIFWFILKDVKLQQYKKWVGPPLNANDNVKAFKRKHNRVFEEGDRICAKVRRKFIKPEDFIRFIIKEDYVKTKIKKIIKVE